MQPATTALTIWKGAKFEYNLVFKVEGVLVDLTGLGPFVAVFVHPLNETVLTELLVTSSYDATGIINVLATAAQTRSLTVDTVRFGVRDALNNPFCQAVCPVKFFSPRPA